MLNEQVYLTEAQVNKIGVMEPRQFEDDEVKKIADDISDKPEFQIFEKIDRSGKYVVCRVKVNDDLVTHRDTNFPKIVQDRNCYESGDMRISFYYATCPNPVQFLAQ